MAKSNKTKKKKEELVAGCQEVECYGMCCLHRRMTKTYDKYCKLNLRYLGNSRWEGLWIYRIHILNNFYLNQNSYEKSHLCLHYALLISFNTAGESDKSYMINHAVHFGFSVFCVKLHAFFIWVTLFFNSALVLFNFFMNWASNVA